MESRRIAGAVDQTCGWARARGPLCGVPCVLRGSEQIEMVDNLEQAVKRFALRLRREHAQEVRVDAKGFKKRVCELVRRNLPPFTGRPTEASITAAAELRKQNRQWKEIYPLVIFGHATLEPPVRRQAESNLRAALRSRRNARGRRNQRRKFIAEETPTPNVPSGPQPQSGLQLGE